jgi:hypothetical protein
LNGNLRFAKKKEIIPNIKLKICRKEIDFLTLREKVKVNFPKNRYIYISPIELQIIYKEEVLKSEKDIEDALHLREVFKNVIDEKKIEEYKKIVWREKNS